VHRIARVSLQRTLNAAYRSRQSIVVQHQSQRSMGFSGLGSISMAVEALLRWPWEAFAGDVKPAR